MERPTGHNLTTKEKKFLAAYIENGNNCTEAFLAVSPHVKRTTARIQGSRTRNRPHVKRALQEYTDSQLIKSTTQSGLTKTKLLEATDWGIDKAKEKEELAALFKGIDVGSKLIGAYSQDEDDESKYARFIQKVSINQLTINQGVNTKEVCQNDTANSCSQVINGECQELQNTSQDSGGQDMST